MRLTRPSGGPEAPHDRRKRNRASVRTARFTGSGLALGLLGALASGAPLGAQQVGTIAGTAVSATTGQPLSDIQISIPGLSLGTLSNVQGRFIILNVPAGTHTIRAERIGFSAAEQSVTVTAGGTATVTFTMESQALGLDEIVVTGAAGAARRREIGNTIEQVTSENIREAPQTVDGLLQGRVTGMTVTQSSGNLGGGAQIRLRGNVSLSQSNQPLIYVDGVRIRSEGLARNVPPVGFQGRSSNVQQSPLNDINPNDIERIEVIKGAAATTLYGTEAAGGVIQIFTKKGRAGAARWNFQTDQTLSSTKAFGFDGACPPSEGDCVSEAGGTPDRLFINPWLRTSHSQNYNLSVSGGGEDLQYFITGNFQDNKGVLPNDEQDKVNVRGNFTFTPRSDLNTQVNVAYTNDELQQTPAGNNAHGLTLNAFRRDRNYRGEETREAIDPILDFDIDTEVNHLVLGLTSTYTPLSNFTHRVTVGWDRIEQDNRNFRPFGFALAPFGIISDQRAEFTTLTGDWVSTFSVDDVWKGIGSSFSFGGQAITTEANSVTAHGEDFPGPGDPVVSNAGDRLGFESRERVINAGFFFQDVLSFRDKYFITGGVRVDGNSAFGSGINLEAYPKVSTSYVLSDESFWNDSWGAMKLRFAWGQSGRAPGAFDSRQTFSAAGFGSEPAFLPSNVGNPDLTVERTSEFEIGFDGSFLNDRVTLDFTAYRQRTKDALFNARQIPSNGFLGSQLENVGKIQNKGVEIGWNALLYEDHGFSWEFGGSANFNKSEILSLGGAPPFFLGGSLAAFEGKPAPVVQGECVTNPDELAEPIVEQRCFFGANEPVRVLQGNTSLTLPWNQIRISLRGEYQGGMWIDNGAASAAISRSVRWPGCFSVYRVEETQGRDAVNAADRARCLNISDFEGGFTIQPADFFKLREATVQIPVPSRWVPQGGNAIVTVSGRNIVRWTKNDLRTLDPEGTFRGGLGGGGGFGRRLVEQVPPPASVTFSVRVTY